MLLIRPTTAENLTKVRRATSIAAYKLQWGKLKLNQDDSIARRSFVINKGSVDEQYEKTDSKKNQFNGGRLDTNVTKFSMKQSFTSGVDLSSSLSDWHLRIAG